VSRYLHQTRVRSRIAPKKTFLTKLHQRRRLEFARKYHHWTPAQRERIIWTDKSTFELGKYSRVIRVWHQHSSEKYLASCITPTFKSSRTSYMIWAAFASNQKSRIVFMPKDQRKASDFVELVYNGELIHFLTSNPSGVILMEDGAPIHRSKLSTTWRELRMINKLEWPTNSPDLNPIENMWKILKDVVQNPIQYGRDNPRSLEEFQGVIESEWKIFSGDNLLYLCQSMPRRLQAVIDAKGGHTQ
jgi:hypothetical protein